MSRMPDDFVDFVFADPPYNLNMNYDLYNDKIKDHEYIDFCKKWFFELKRISKKILITPGTKNLSMWNNQIEIPKHIGCWYKSNSMTGCKFSNLNLWEPLLFYFYNEKRYSIDSINSTISAQKYGRIGITEIHPCPKPLFLLRNIIILYTDENDLVYDPFSGSGTTAIASYLEGRPFLASEISQEYVDLANKRLQPYLSQKTLF